MGTNALRLLKQIEGIRLKHLAGRHDQKSHAPNTSHIGEHSDMHLVDDYAGIVPADSQYGYKLSNEFKSYYINDSGKILDVGNVGHIGALADREAGKFLGLNDWEIGTSRRDLELGEFSSRFFDKAIAHNVRVFEPNDSVNIQTAAFDDRTLSKLQKFYDSGKLGLPTDKKVVWEDVAGSEHLESSVEDFLSAKTVRQLERMTTMKQSTYTAPIMSYNESRERGQIADVYTAPYDGQTIGTWLDKRGVERTDQGMYVFYIPIREDSHGVERGRELESKPEDVKLGKGERVCRLELRPTQIDGNDKAILREDLRW